MTHEPLRSAQEIATDGQSRWRGMSASTAQTLALGSAIGRFAQADDVIWLLGELGAGKTQLVRGLVQALGMDPAVVCSPTFVLMQRYADPQRDVSVIHVDAYRLEGVGDGESIGWDSDLCDGAVVVVEWANRLAKPWPDDRLEVELAHTGMRRRQVSVTAYGSWRARMQRCVVALDAAVRQGSAVALGDDCEYR